MNNDQMTDDVFWARAFMVFLTKTTVFTAASYADDSLTAFRERFPKETDNLRENYEAARLSIEYWKGQAELQAQLVKEIDARARSCTTTPREDFETLKEHVAQGKYVAPKPSPMTAQESQMDICKGPASLHQHVPKPQVPPDASEVVEAAREVLSGFVTIGMNEDTRMCQIPWQSMVKLEKSMHKFRLERVK